MVAVLAEGLEVCMDCAMLIANDEATPEHREQFIKQGHEGFLVLTGEGDVDDTPFSTRRCDGCGSDLAGYRTAAAMLSR